MGLVLNKPRSFHLLRLLAGVLLPGELCNTKYIATLTSLINLERTMNTDMHQGKTMAGNTENGGGRRWSRGKIAAWAVAAIILLLPAVAMQFTDEVNWGVADFAIFGALLVGVLVTYELVTKMTGDTAYRAAVGVALAAVFILIWVNGAVGIIGSEDNDANLMYFGVLAVGDIGAFIVR